jgi:hypothetical protein
VVVATATKVVALTGRISSSGMVGVVIDLCDDEPLLTTTHCRKVMLC